MMPPDSNSSLQNRGLQITSILLFLLGVPAVAIQSIAVELYTARMARNEFKHLINGDFEMANIGSGIAYVFAGALGLAATHKSSRTLRTSCYTVSIVSMIASVICTIISVTQVIGISVIINSLEEDCVMGKANECDMNQLILWFALESAVLAINVAAVIVLAAHVKMMSKGLRPSTQVRSSSDQVIFNITITNHPVDDPPPPYPSEELPTYEQYHSL